MTSSRRAWILAAAATLAFAAAPTGGCSSDDGGSGGGVQLSTGTTTSGAGGAGGATSTTSGGGQGGAGGTGGAAPACDNMTKDGEETDVDCGGGLDGPGAGGAGGGGGAGGAGGADGAGGAGGGPPPLCPRCEVGRVCVGPYDCISQSCVDGVCAAETCDDGIKNGAESDVDCGGAGCPPCAPGDGCVVDGDCDSLKCDALVCAVPICSDNIENGEETDEDCGGPVCGKCVTGDACLLGGDCVSGVCAALVCAAASCFDGVKNGNETDIDCGGACMKNCDAGQSCNNNTDCASNSCKNTICQCPAGMTIVPALGGGTYCIDVTEATNEEYLDFYTSNPVYDIDRCESNIDYNPMDPTWDSDPTKADKPVVGIDWCDAAAYCTYKNKHVCGQVGGTTIDPGEYANASLDEWYNACSQQGTQLYPYGNAYAAATCNGADKMLGDTYVVRTGAMNAAVPSCPGGINGAFQMSGNAAEWENACNLHPSDPAQDSCRVRGGSYLSTEPALLCTASDFRLRGAKSADVGVRCCL